MSHIVVLAAGRGTRMRSRLPKVLQQLGGQSLLQHVLTAARALQPERIVVVTGHEAEQVQAACSGDADVACVVQAPQLGTGHAVQQALPLLPDTGRVLVLYGDVPCIRPDTLQRLLDVSADAVGLLTVILPQPTGYGRIVRDAQGRVQRIVEERDATADERAITEVNTGILSLPAGFLRTGLAQLTPQNAQGEYYLTDLIGLAVDAGLAIVTTQPAIGWETAGVNDRAQLAALERQYQLAQAETQLAAGVSLADPARFDVRGTLTCGQDVSIDVGCVFEGRVVLGDGVAIGPHCVVRDCEIGPDVVIEAFSHLDGARIAQGAHVGPYARLRPGTELGEGSRIGNFVEVKNASFGPQAKANHLAYLGDATIGARVNVGAGVITCNYDGANKHRTEIGDDAFIGSDTQLVAPVTVGAGATIGAGTTLTKAAPAESLTISRAPQRSIAGWLRPRKGGR